jgi:hypothetical protein
MGKIAPGIYIRDISEIREGMNSYHFKNYSPRPTDEDRLLSIVGTEKTISLELPSQVNHINRLRLELSLNFTICLLTVYERLVCREISNYYQRYFA